MSEKEENLKEDETIDLGKAKDSFFKLFGKKGKELKSKEKKIEKKVEDELKVDWKKAKEFIVKNRVILLLLIPIFLSIYFRMYSAYLPMTDEWAENSAYSNIRADISRQIDLQYPNLLAANKQTIVDQEFNKIIKEQKSQIEQQIKGTSDYFKSKMQDDQGQTYLLAIDPYFWYGQAKNYVENGHFGDELIEGVPTQTLRNGKVGKKAFFSINPYIEASLYKISKVFNPNTSLMGICFIIPVLLITLSVIPAFFIGKKIAGNLAGVFAGIFVAVQPFLLGRTAAGFADTDPYQIFFPLFIIWTLFIAFESEEKLKKSLIFAGIAGLLVGLYSLAWSGWWYIFNLVVALLIIYLLYWLFIYRKEIKNNFLEGIKKPVIKNTLVILVIFILCSVIFVSLLNSLLFGGAGSFFQSVLGPISFIQLKEVGITTIWPNVFTTVAEFNEIPLNQIISLMGGNFLFLMAMVGIVLTAFKRKHGKFDIKYVILLTIWFIGATYAFTKGTRFAILLIPAFALAFGTAVGSIYKYSTKWLTKIDIKEGLSKIGVIVLLCLLLIAPIKAADATARNEIPSMNDAWYDSLIEIKNNSTDGIITSWWDFGHWFVAIAERRVTFDGGDQGKRIHWVGKTLQTDDEKQAIDILRMLNCDQIGTHTKLKNYLGDDFKAVNLAYEIISKNKEGARNILEKNNLTEDQINDVLMSTHCDNLLDQYYIASEDMVGKAGVWGHFGSWDFKRADMYRTIKGKPQEEGIKILEEEFDLSSNEAFTIYHEIQTQPGDSWITGWPSYFTGLNSCEEKNKTIECSMSFNVGNLLIRGIIIEKETMEVSFTTEPEITIHPKSLVYPILNEDGEKDVFEKIYVENNIPVSAALIQQEDGTFKCLLADPSIINSMFTKMFFFEGRGLKNFELLTKKTQFTGGKIYVYKVNLENPK